MTFRERSHFSREMRQVWKWERMAGRPQVSKQMGRAGYWKAPLAGTKNSISGTRRQNNPQVMCVWQGKRHSRPPPASSCSELRPQATSVLKLLQVSEHAPLPAATAPATPCAQALPPWSALHPPSPAHSSGALARPSFLLRPPTRRRAQGRLQRPLPSRGHTPWQAGPAGPGGRARRGVPGCPAGRGAT